jgi:predicted small metal-binding protein
MKEFRCRDVVPECPYVTRDENEEALWAQISEHARDAHGMDEVPPEVVDAIRGVIVEV